MFKSILKHEIFSFLLFLIPLFTFFCFPHKVLIYIKIPILQLLSVLAVIFINWGFFILAHKKMQTVNNHYYCMNLILTISCFALAGFSQEELKQLGFIFQNNSDGIFYYLVYKTLFNLIGLYNLPNALKFFLGREKFRNALISILKQK